MRHANQASKNLQALTELLWYARHKIASETDPERDKTGEAADHARWLERELPDLRDVTGGKWWLDPRYVGRLEGQVSALRWMLMPKEYDEQFLGPWASATGLFDS